MRAHRRRLQNGREFSSPGKLESCQVGRETERPCPNPAAVEIRGVPFCAWCAREQEAYFTVGEITREPTDDRMRQAHHFLDGRLDEAEEYAEVVK